MQERHTESVTRRVSRHDHDVPEGVVERVDRAVTSSDAPVYGHHPGVFVSRAVYLVFGVIESLLIIRFVLKALGANEGAGFTSFIYGLTEPLLAPFAGMFGTPATEQGSVLEIHTLVAIVVYALVAWLVAALLNLLFSGRRSTV